MEAAWAVIHDLNTWHATSKPKTGSMAIRPRHPASPRRNCATPTHCRPCHPCNGPARFPPLQSPNLQDRSALSIVRPQRWQKLTLMFIPANGKVRRNKSPKAENKQTDHPGWPTIWLLHYHAAKPGALISYFRKIRRAPTAPSTLLTFHLQSGIAAQSAPLACEFQGLDPRHFPSNSLKIAVVNAPTFAKPQLVMTTTPRLEPG